MKVWVTLFLAISIGRLQAQCVNGQSTHAIKVGEMKANLQLGGHFWNMGPGLQLDTGQAPSLSPFANIWIGCKMGDTDYLAVAGKNHISQYEDFYPGPLDDRGMISAASCMNWDQQWVVSRDQVISHINDYSDGVIDQPQESIFSWPGRNSTVFRDYSDFDLPQDVDLAPFVDLNGDGDYQPFLGEYPDVKGDQNVWWVTNDAHVHNQTQAPALQAEIKMLAYSYESGDSTGVLFYDVEVVNKSLFTYRDFYIGFWYSPVLGCPDDDYSGFDVDANMSFTYNNHAVVDNCSPYTDGPNNHKAGVLAVGQLEDYPHSKGVTSWIYYERINQVIGDPIGAKGFYNLLQGRFVNGEPITQGGTGYDPSSVDSTKYAFTGNPSDPNAWSMCAENLPQDSRRIVMSSGGYSMEPGDKVNYTYAVFYEPDVGPCPDINSLKDRMGLIRQGSTTSTQEAEVTTAQTTLIVQPNPASDFVEAILGNAEDVYLDCKLYSLGGDLVHRTKKQSPVVFEVTDLPTGMYILVATDQKGNRYHEKIIVGN